MSSRVLVADGSGTMRKIIARSLVQFGFTDVVEAADGNEAIACCRKEAFALVLTEWNLSNKSGLEVLREIRARDSEVPVLMVTTEGDRRCVMQAIEAGVSDYLLKPFTADDLRDKLQSLSARR